MKVLIVVLSFLSIPSTFWSLYSESTTVRPLSNNSTLGFDNKEDATDWKLSVSKGDIKVYTRPNPDSGIKEVRITTPIKTSLSGLMAMLGDVDAYTNWVYKCSAAKRLETLSEQDFYYYAATDMPFPIKDRDLVVRSKQWQDINGVVHSESLAVPHFIPIDESRLRIEFFKSNWTITPDENGMVSIDYTVKTDPGGNIPVWLINMAITKGPLKTMEQLIQLVQQEKYQKAKHGKYLKEGKPQGN